tara:strand:+ start:235 stop:447 length:213 start_codon:yes stop_codon:yes gene_type:complete
MADQITITANGKEYSLTSGITLAGFMSENNIAAEKTVAAVNGDIIKRDETASCVLADGDKLELMTFAGGG